MSFVRNRPLDDRQIFHSRWRYLLSYIEEKRVFLGLENVKKHQIKITF